MSFFQSEFVKKEMQAITDIQEKIYESVFKFHTMNVEDKLEHIEMLEELLNKQQVLYTRLSLSDDPAAKEMKENVMKEARMIGFPENTDLPTVFKNMTMMIENMKRTIKERG
tara:strand:- start:1412 stop:1747 length:336 start_codon:yes stop_codon:yes gene_type:complete